MLKSLLGIARQWSREKCAILPLKLRSHNRILTYRTWAINASQNAAKHRVFSQPRSEVLSTTRLLGTDRREPWERGWFSLSIQI